MITKAKLYARKELFKHYNNFDNPFLICTTKIDVTNIVEYCKKNKHFYGTFGYLITKTVNAVDAFKYRYYKNKIYYCDEINSNYVELHEDNNIGYFIVPFINEYKDYIESFKQQQNNFKNSKKTVFKNNINEIWLSCTPWFSFESLTPVFNKKITIPQFIWDKYQCVDGKYYVNLMIAVHHGFADGFHVGKFVKKLQESIDTF